MSASSRPTAMPSSAPKSPASTSGPNPFSAPFQVPTVTWSTNMGSLTTPVSLPSDCLESLWDLHTPGLMPGEIYTYYTQGCAMSTCCPSNTPYSKSWEWLSTYYSPGVCPMSYRACAPPPDFGVEDGEKVAFCCPLKYECPGQTNILGWWACNSLMSTPTFAVVVNNPTDQIVVTTTDVAEPGNWFNVVYPLQVRWKPEDASLLITGTSEPTASSKGSGGELNISSIVIITIVCVLTLISGIISTIWWARRKKRKQQTALEIVGTETVQVVDTQQEFPPELHGQGV